jgi:hypothetical protein
MLSFGSCVTDTARSLFVVALLGSAACNMGRATAYMKPLTPGAPAFRSDAQTATLVFGQAHRMTSGRLFTILDDQGKFVGDLPGKSAFALSLTPGHHAFVLVAFDDTQWDILSANLAPGGVYYVDVIDGNHPLTDRRQPYFWPSKRGGDPSYTLHTLPEHLKDATWSEPDVAAGNRYFDTQTASIQGVLKDANEERTRDEQHPGLGTLMHTLNPDDALPP